MKSEYNVALLTISDSASRGEREDKSGKLLRELVGNYGYQVTDYQIIPDDETQITNHMLLLVDEKKTPLILTTGGTGISPRDVTPEATRRVIEKELPGFSETMRAAGRKTTHLADVSRAVCGVRGKTLIINFPGSTCGVLDGFKAVLPAINHVLDILSGKVKDCGKDTASPVITPGVSHKK